MWADCQRLIPDWASTGVWREGRRGGLLTLLRPPKQSVCLVNHLSSHWERERRAEEKERGDVNRRCAIDQPDKMSGGQRRATAAAAAASQYLTSSAFQKRKLVASHLPSLPPPPPPPESTTLQLTLIPVTTSPPPLDI